MLVVKNLAAVLLPTERIMNVARRCDELRKSNDVVVVLSAMGRDDGQPS